MTATRGSTRTVRVLVPLMIMLLGAHRRSSAVHPLLVVLIDGFRYDYMDDLRGLLGFRELVETGVKVDYLTPDFPSLSYPNYYSLMTGRHCDTHQIIGNYMWDEASKKEFLIGTNPDSRLALWWNGSEPLWVTLQKSEKKVFMYFWPGNYMWDEASKKQFLIGTNPDSRLGLWWKGSEPLWVTLQKSEKKVFMYFWPGCEVEILGVYPSFCEEYVYNPSEKNLTDSMVNALSALRSGHADMAAIYYEKIDVEGHHYGPDSEQVRTAVQELDLALQMLNNQIKEKKMVNQLNIMLFSDHGMTKIKWMEKVIELDKYINMSDLVKMMDRGSVVSLWPKENKYQEVYASLLQVPNMHLYARQNIPERFHYKMGRFVSPLTLVAEPGWFIIENKAKLPYWNNNSGEPSAFQNGWHGYDNEFLDMRGFFLASGPDFRRNLQAAPIRSVDIYNLMCWTLGVKPLPNNGSWSRVEYFLNSPGPTTNPWSFKWVLFGTLLAVRF